MSLADRAGGRFLTSALVQHAENNVQHLENMRGEKGRLMICPTKSPDRDENARMQIDSKFDRFGRVFGDAHRAGPFC
jgi:hypothetical protein